MKILWALLDVATIVVLGSGLYLWLRKGAQAGSASNASTSTATAAATVHGHTGL
eukprot:gene44977-60042_t